MTGLANASSPTVQRIVGLVKRYSYMTKYVALLNPAMLYRLFGRSLDSGTPVPYSDAHWRTVVARCKLTPQQVTAILACAELYFKNLDRLLVERAGLQQQLQLAQEAVALPQINLPDTMQVLDGMYRNLRRENSMRNMLSCFVWGRVLNSIQFAKAAVYSHPFMPDVHALVTVLVMEHRPQLLAGLSSHVAAARAAAAPVPQQQQQGPAAMQLV